MDEGKKEVEIATADESFSIWARHPRLFDRYKRLKTTHVRNWQTFNQVYWVNVINLFIFFIF